MKYLKYFSYYMIAFVLFTFSSFLEASSKKHIAKKARSLNLSQQFLMDDKHAEQDAGVSLIKKRNFNAKVTRRNNSVRGLERQGQILDENVTAGSGKMISLLFPGKNANSDKGLAKASGKASVSGIRSMERVLENLMGHELSPIFWSGIAFLGCFFCFYSSGFCNIVFLIALVALLVGKPGASIRT